MATIYSDSTSINQREETIPNIYVRDISQVRYHESSVQENMHYVNFISSAPYSDSSAITTLSQQDIYLHDPFVSRGHNHNDMLTDNSQNFHTLNSLSSEQPIVSSLSLDMQTPKHSSYLRNSKYLKAAQQLLDELVNVQSCNKKRKDANKESNYEAMMLYNTHQECINSSCNQLSALEKQELQSRVEKLLIMVDKLEQRYKEYHNQLHEITTTFDALTRPQASKPYTTLALQTISRQFRSLKDAITSQISSIRTKLGEQARSSEKGVGISRLRYIDQKIKQERTMQQFGMMQSNVWRPQRGLPENSVSVLRAWLFEHFLHPYPKDSEKLMLAKQTGLTRGQVANWFINARVRLWKPMIEEMYQEEIGETQNPTNSSSDKPLISLEETKGNKENEVQRKSNSIASVNLSAEDAFMDLKLREQMANIERNGNSVYENGRMVPYQMPEINRFANGVSLTLGLQNCDVGLQNLDEEFEYMNVPLHMMHDFVA